MTIRDTLAFVAIIIALISVGLSAYIYFTKSTSSTGTTGTHSSAATVVTTTSGTTTLVTANTPTAVWKTIPTATTTAIRALFTVEWVGIGSSISYVQWAPNVTTAHAFELFHWSPAGVDVTVDVSLGTGQTEFDITCQSNTANTVIRWSVIPF